ncbi:hypothetical protein [Dietzia aerolata]|uniref:Uncharacterized protein n=3 Tax=Dietzia aerolata TaxID=595984 RepID=A0ABV5JMY8_9ACTN
MTFGRSARTGAAVLAATLAAPLATLGLGVGTAQAAPRRAQLTYDCLAAAQGFEGDARPYPFVVALDMDVPDSLAPGDTVALNGSFSVQMPEDLRALAADYFTTLQVVSDSLSVPVTVGGNTVTVPMSRFDSGQMPASMQPFIVSGAVGADPYQVPADAAGEVHIGMPSGGATSIINGAPVAFNAQALLSGGFVANFVGEYPYLLSCNPPAGDTTLATIPISAPESAAPAAAPAAAPGASSTRTGAATPATGGPGTTVTNGAPAAPAPAAPAGGAQQAAGAGAPSVAGAQGVGAQGVGTQNVAANPGLIAQTSPSRGQDVWIPGWLVATVAALAALAAVAVAVRGQLKLSAFRDELEG